MRHKFNSKNRENDAIFPILKELKVLEYKKLQFTATPIRRIGGDKFNSKNWENDAIFPIFNSQFQRN